MSGFKSGLRKPVVGVARKWLGRLGLVRPKASSWASLPLHLWQLDDGSGYTLANTGSGGGAGTLDELAEDGWAWKTSQTIGTGSFTVLQNHGDGAPPDSASGATATIPDPNTTTFTYAVWVKPADLSTQYRALSKGTRLWAMATASGLPPPFDIPNFNVGGSYKASTAAVTTGSWQHLAFVKDGTTLTFYKNGVAAGVHTSLSAEAWSTTTQYILRHSSTGLAWYGQAYQLALWDSALPATGTDSIDKLYNSGTPLALV